MGSIRLSMRVFVARAGAAALAMPMLLGGAVPASAAIVTHTMTPATGSGVLYEYAGTAEDLGQVLRSCQSRDRSNLARPFCYGPDQIRAAYDIQPLLDHGVDGTGRTIVIIDAFQSPTIQDDLKLFDQFWGKGYPDPTLNILHPFGLTPYDVNDPNQRSWAGEISLDVEWAHVVAPGATIDLVLAPSNQDADILAVTRWAVDQDLGDVISQSFGEAEACMDPALVAQQHEVFTHASAKGITLFASSGDLGAAQPSCNNTALVLSASTPASDPEVTAVGGTHLVADKTSGARQSESTWNDIFGATGGGFSTIYHRPGYQAPFQGNNKQRGVPDVAYNGDVWGGVLGVWGSSGLGPGLFFIFGGTSAGSPQWAGIVALADQMGGHRLRAINTPLYHIAKSDAYASAFHDITDGNNGFGGVAGFPAGPGWDAATGLGTPDVAHLIPLLL